MRHTATNEKNWLLAHKHAETSGMAIPKGTRIKMSSWAHESNLSLWSKVETGVKVSNARDGRCIRVKRDGLKTVCNYWAGFWERE